MTVQLSTTVRNAKLDAIETTIGTAPTLEIRTGTKPANCAAADSGTVVASMTLPSDWANAAASGSKTLLGTWQDLVADNDNTGGGAMHFRIKAGATCHMQGSVTATGGGGDMTIDNLAVAAGQTVSVTGFTMTEGNA